MVYIQEYLEMVENEKEHLVCKEQKQFAIFIRKVLKDKNVYIDEEKVEKYLSYQKYFPFELFPWEKCLLVLMLCTYCKDSGLPRFSTLFCMIGRTEEVVKMLLFHTLRFVYQPKLTE